MSQKKQTKDVRFLIKLEELTRLSPEIDRYTVGYAVGLKPCAVDQIVRHAAQANFIKKSAGDEISLSEQGHRFLREL
jgi:hypothetical protein